MRIALTFAILAILTAGCTEPTAGTAPSTQILARDLTVVVSAGAVWHIDFYTQGGFASYDFSLTDDSSVDIGFMRTQNVKNYAEGSTANVYGFNDNVRRARDSASLDNDYWSLFIGCNNAFADCDGILARATIQHF